MPGTLTETLPDLHHENDGSWRIGAARLAAANEAAHEIEQHARLLKKLFLEDCSESDLALRGLAMRVEELSTVVMAALGDGAEPTEEIEARLRS